MDLDKFEQLVSQWLDQREDEDLSAQIAAAIAGNPELQRARDEWLRFDEAIRKASPDISSRIDWNRWNARVAETTSQIGASELQERTLREATSSEQRVDWNALRGRIMQSVAADRRSSVRGRAASRRQRIVLTTLSAAAAFLLVAFFYPTGSSDSTLGVARVQVSASDDIVANVTDDSAFSSVQISAPPDFVEPEPVQVAVEDTRVVEVFLMVEPARTASRASMPGSPFGFN